MDKHRFLFRFSHPSKEDMIELCEVYLSYDRFTNSSVLRQVSGPTRRLHLTFSREMRRKGRPGCSWLRKGEGEGYRTGAEEEEEPRRPSARGGRVFQ